MAITFTQLKTRLEEWTENTATEYTGTVSEFIRLGQQRMERELGALEAFRAASTLTTTQATVALSTQAVRILWIKNQGGDYLQRKDESFIREFVPSATYFGTPRFYAYTAAATQIIVAPTPSQSLTFDYGYQQRLAALSTTASTNWLTDYAENAFTFCCMLAAYKTFLKPEQADVDRMEQLYEQEKAWLIKEELEKKKTDEFRTPELP